MTKKKYKFMRSIEFCYKSGEPCDPDSSPN